jgi:NAD(P)-dependent dehydrogenase (short-subunit alcohol dehydrogenase family)
VTTLERITGQALEFELTSVRFERVSASATSIFDLHGRVAIVTGASAGLGARFAAALAGAGAHVVACARRLAPLERLAEEHPGIEPARCDVTDQDQIRALVDKVRSDHGQIDICVNNAGISSGGPDQQADPATFAKVLDVNVRSLFALTQLVAEPMLARGGGSIVNISSMFGQVAASPAPEAGYVASKAAVNGLTRELAAQWAHAGVRVNALAPGWFPTEMNAELFADERAARFVARTCPMGRPGRPHELDGALLFLASDASSYCTGQVIVVDGGWTLR